MATPRPALQSHSHTTICQASMLMQGKVTRFVQVLSPDQSAILTLTTRGQCLTPTNRAAIEGRVWRGHSRKNNLESQPAPADGCPPRAWFCLRFLPKRKFFHTTVETSALFVRGLCRWPGCDVLSEDFPSFLKHLHSEHSRCDRSIAQWKVQQDIVQCMESQLILEKQKLLAMQLHLHLSEHKYTDLAASEWPYSLPVFLAQPQPQPQVTDGDRVQQWDIKHLQELSQHGYRAAGSDHLLPDLVPSIECYKYNNIRPPYTYAYLIRWAILESSDKQRTLNEIYNWFTTMFFYFRHNTATWKNAVRHNLSLHKCFVRVEGGKGAVWTVDESEYQRRKGPKYHRDCPVKWLTSYPHYCPEEA
uniref:Forkhead box P3b n=1 Tax=Sander lucioperca TaxID=283035 RepID=A0A8D0AQP4_SANLU